MNDDTPEPTPAKPPFTVEHITPEMITEQQRDILAPIFNAELEEMVTAMRGRMHRDVLNAGGDRAKLEGIRQMAKGFAAQLSRWNDNPRTSDKLKALQQSYEDLAEDIAASFRGELPEQQEGEEWKQ